MRFIPTLLILFLLSFGTVQGQSAKQVKKLIRDGNVKAISELIASGKSITTYKRQGTLLHIAAEYKQLEIVKLLVDKGADLNLRNKLKYTPLMISTSSEWRNDSIAAYLINHGADLNVAGDHGTTALRNTIHIGTGSPNVPIFKLLVSKGADISYSCKECCNRTAFLFSCAWGTEEMVRVLLDKKTDINQVDCDGLNGLMYAIKLKNIPVIKQLLQAGISPDHKDNKQQSAMDYALKSKDAEIIALFTK